MKPIKITLGAHTYTVEEQPMPYLEMEFEEFAQRFQGVSSPEDLADVVVMQDGSPADVPAGRKGFGQIAGPGYDVLRVFIPDLMPEWEFRGYASEAAFQAGVRDRETARLGATVPQIKRAFEAVFLVNELDVLKHLGKVVPAELIQAFAKKAVGDSVSELLSSSLLPFGE